MKQLMLLFALLCSMHNIYAQDGELLPSDQTTNKVSYSGIVDAPGLTKKVLFENTKKWIKTKNTEVNPYVINYESDADGNITGKGSFSLPGDRRKYTVQFTVKILTK